MKKGRLFLISSMVVSLFASQGLGATQEDLLRRIEELSKELEALKAQLKEVKAKQETQEEKVSAVEKTAKSLKENLGNIKIGGDIRTRIDSTRATVKRNAFMLGMMEPIISDPSMATNLIPYMTYISSNFFPIYQSGNYYLSDQSGNNLSEVYHNFYKKTRAHKEENDSLWTNRLRLDLSVKPTENTIAKVRLAYNKAWGMGDDYFGPHLFFPMKNNFTYGVKADDSRLYVDRAYFNISYLFDKPIWISFGRRPTTHGTPPGV